MSGKVCLGESYKDSVCRYIQHGTKFKRAQETFYNYEYIYIYISNLL